MNHKEREKMKFDKFSNLISISTQNHLDDLVINSYFTSAFNYRIKKMFDEIKRERKSDIDFSVIFNTKDEVAIIDTKIIGDFIADEYSIMIEKYYRNEKMYKLINKISNGSEKVHMDFVNISYLILYKIIDELYEEIISKKSLVNKLKIRYGIINYDNEDKVIIILSMLILEDICRYVDVDRHKLVKYVKKLI